MAYIASTAFEPRVTNKARDNTLNITGRFKEGSPLAEAICSAGFLCKKSSLLANEGYSGIYNTNSHIMVAAIDTDLAGTPIYACNTYGVNEITDPVTGNVFKVGANTLGLPAASGRDVTFTRIVFDGNNIYRFGIGNLSAAISSNTHFTIDDGLLVPGSAPTANGVPYFKLVGTGKFTEGNIAGFTYYDVVALTCVSSVASGS